MPQRYYNGFDFDIVGDFSFNVTDDGDGKAYEITKASLAGTEHFHGFTDGGDYAEVEDAFETALNTAAAAAGSSVTWTFTWSNATVLATVSGDQGNIAITLDTAAQNLFGMAASLSGATSYASTVRPYYVIVCANDAIRVGSSLPKVLPQNSGRRNVTQGGRSVGVHPTEFALDVSWVQEFETDGSAIYIDLLVAAVPWTYQHMFETAGANEKIVLVRTNNATISFSATDVKWSFFLNTDRGFIPSLKRPNRIDYINVPFAGIIADYFVL